MGHSVAGSWDTDHAAVLLRDNHDMQEPITRDPEVMHGTPVFRGTRVPVQTLFDYLKNGQSLDDFLEGFPTVGRDLAVQVLEESKDLRLARLMRILLDECVDQRLRLRFPGHECQTAAYAGLAGLKNGMLLAAAEAGGFEVLITVDQKIPLQQNLGVRRISVLVLCGPTNRLADPEPLIPTALQVLDGILPGSVLQIA